MLTLVTGLPGASKSAYTVWEFCRAIPGTTIEAQDDCTSHGVTYRKGDAVPRRLFSNINGLLVDHVLIDASSLERWQEWAQPGDIIVFDEVQSVWRTRAMGQKVPECIQALETHRHMGVDFFLITQHPMLLDPNVRRLCDRHIHLRRISSSFSYRYQWDHCGNPGQYRTCLESGVWRRPRAVHGLYKSAQLHTKHTQRLPKVAYLIPFAVAIAGYTGSKVYGSMVARVNPPGVSAPLAAASASAKPASLPAGVPAGSVVQSVQVGSPDAPVVVQSQPEVSGCVKTALRCACFDKAGLPKRVEPAVCEASIPVGGAPADLSGLMEVRTARRPSLPALQPGDAEVLAWMAKRR